MSDRPVFRQIADTLRQQIRGGDLAPGTQLPSERELNDRFGVSTTTTRDALSLLRAEGLIVSVKGRGSFVRPQHPVRRLSSDRYRDQLTALAAGAKPTESAFSRDHNVSFNEVTVDCLFGEIEASDRVADLMGVDAGTHVFERQMVMRAADQAEQIRTAWYPLDIVTGTPMTDPSRQPWPGGVIAELAALGITPTRIDEDVIGRMPTPEEASTLRMHTGTPVLQITRVAQDAHSHVGEVADIVLPADRVRLHYSVEL